MEEKALHLAKTLWMVHGVVKSLIDRTAEAAVLCKDAAKGDGSSEKMREYYKGHGAKIQQIITPGSKAVQKLYSKYPKLANHLCQYKHDEVKISEQLLDLVCAVGTIEKSGK